MTTHYMFEHLLDSLHFGPRNGFEFRGWQSTCLADYVESATRFRDSFGSDARHQYSIVAGTGSGKTKCAAGVAAWLLNKRLVDQLVFVCPNRSIRRKTQKDFKAYFDIHLAVFNKKRHLDGIPREQQGYILTYGHLMQDPTLHRRICLRTSTLVIFDEVHHLGDKGTTWGDSAKEARFLLFIMGKSESDRSRTPKSSTSLFTKKLATWCLRSA